ncbi:adenylate/guanylate cyclase domain-containing protein [Echinicola shivajiensis]|uniref:adenylate/guanylate cyclase domain-containing protein n=1 Tax=Echinicola shivajiensis TaxID=1035916 RepID=UPI001BFC00A5|nr:adenylate/guanylate cyclase domain-containing protein [Echinicola shivajiensis]
MPKSAPKLKYVGINREIELQEDFENILEVSIANKIPHLHECGGNGRCTTCRIRVIDGMQHLSPPDHWEQKVSRIRNWDPSIRLACQAKVHGDATIQRLVWTSAEISKLQLETLPEDVGEERSLAILFCDMRDFTSIASQHTNFDLAHMLNRFFTILGDPILMNDGIIYQYAGDEIIGLFGTGGGDTDKICLDALRAGLGMLYAVERLNKMELKDFSTVFQVGIGIHFGHAFVGNLGHPKHKQFTVLGDPVNVASRIQNQNKELGTKLLVSKVFMENLPKNTVKIGKTTKVSLKGKQEEFELFEMRGFAHFDTNLEVQASLDLLLKNEDGFAQRFYDKLFIKAPSVQQLFKKNMLEQGRMLTHMLSGIIYSLSRPEHLKMGLHKLGKQHIRYGVKKEYYPILREVMLEAIKEELGESHNENIQKAWENAIDMVTALMKESYD